MKRTRNQIIRRNVLVTPIVLLVRVPLLAPLVLLHWIGEAANNAADWIAYRVPGWDRLPIGVSQEQRWKIMDSFGVDKDAQP